MLRLSLSNSMIIGGSRAGPPRRGHVIEVSPISSPGGSVFLGLVIVLRAPDRQFHRDHQGGAGRMARVGASFALDAMPGKRLAIDADMAASAISLYAGAAGTGGSERETAFRLARRRVEIDESDAIAGLLIRCSISWSGLAMGVLVRGMPLDNKDLRGPIRSATVGDGLVTQIPTVIISIASAMLLSKGRHGRLDRPRSSNSSAAIPWRSRRWGC